MATDESFVPACHKVVLAARKGDVCEEAATMLLCEEFEVHALAFDLFDVSPDHVHLRLVEVMPSVARAP